MNGFRLAIGVLFFCLTYGALQTVSLADTDRIASHGIVFTGMSFDAKNTLAAAAAAAGSKMIRMDMTWLSAQPLPPPAPYDWRWMDDSVRAARSNNLEILALVAETPAWASSQPNDPSSRSFPPARWQDWEAFIKALVDRYGVKGTNQIHYWEIWGEANDAGQWLGTPADYAQLYSRAYNIIKSSDPGAQVLMAGMNEWNQPDWLNAVLNDPVYPAKNKIDIVDLHIRGSFERVKSLVAAWGDLFRAQGIQNKAAWVTEFGFPSDPVFQQQWNSTFIGANTADGEQKQADYYNTVIPWLLNQAGVGKLFVTLRDLDAPDTPWDSEGIITKTPSPKISFNAVKALAATYNGTAPAPTPAPAPAPPKLRWRR